MFLSDINYHREFLADQARVSTFRLGIAEAIKPGDVVLDLGAGTGILGLLACRAGAARVYSIDEGPMIELAREFCQANGFQDRMVFIKGLSTEIDLPERVDVVVADQIGPFGFEAGLLQYFNDAATRFLKPDGVLLPSRVELFVVPVECPEAFALVDFWNDYTEYNFRSARSLAVNTAHLVKFTADQLLGEPSLGTTIVLRDPIPKYITLETSIVAKRSGVVHGIGGWFSAQLSDNVALSSSPFAKPKIARMNVFFPIDCPTPLKKDDQVRINICILPTEFIITWKMEVWENCGEGRLTKKAEFSHSTFHGMVICKEDLHRTQPHYIPKLSRWGKSRLSVLSLCDGSRTLFEIEQEVYRRHRSLFSSPAKAAEFVSQVITRYST